MLIFKIGFGNLFGCVRVCNFCYWVFLYVYYFVCLFVYLENFFLKILYINNYVMERLEIMDFLFKFNKVVF